MPGDVVVVCGIVCQVNSQSNRKGKMAESNSLYILYIEANSIQKAGCVEKDTSSNKLKADVHFSNDELRHIKDIVEYSQCNVFDRIVHSFCPGIFGNYIVKAGLMLCLFGGSTNDSRNNSCHMGLNRTASHILVVGDPGLGKSQVRYFHYVEYRYIFVDVKSSIDDCTSFGICVWKYDDNHWHDSDDYSR